MSQPAVRAPLDPVLARRRLAVFTVMLVVGVCFSSWVVRTPAVRDLLSASTAQMGLVLFGLSVGSMTGVLSSAPLVRARGARLTIAAGATSLVGGTAVIALAAGASSTLATFAGLVLVGLGFGLCEIAINVEGAVLEVASGRSVLPVLHGCYSLGTVVGALVGIALTAVDFPVVWHLAAVCVVAVAALAWAVPVVPAATGRVEQVRPNPVPHGQGPARESTVRRAASGLRAQLGQWRQRRTAFLGLVVLGLALAEGSATDWLPLLVVDGHGASATFGSFVFAGFAAAMTAGRFAGEPLLERFGHAAVLRVSSLVSAVGIAVVALSPDLSLAAVGAVLWGLGAALGFPVTLSAAADSDDPTSSVAAVAVAGYLAFLVGPPLLGFVGEHVGLRGAVLVVLVVVVAASFLTSAARPRDRSAPTAVSEQ